jgi:hypothetical protein
VVGGAGDIGAVGTELLLQPVLRNRQRTVKKRTMPERRARTTLILKRSDVRVVQVARLETYTVECGVVRVSYFREGEKTLLPISGPFTKGR